MKTTVTKTKLVQVELPRDEVIKALLNYIQPRTTHQIFEQDVDITIKPTGDISVWWSTQL